MDTKQSIDHPDAHTTDPRGPDAPAHVRLAASRTEYDALADLFLGDLPGTRDPSPPARAAHPLVDGTAARATRTEDRPHPSSHPAPQPRRALPVEAVVLGHLPVRAAIWVRQYAGMVAERAKAPVALVRLQQQTLSIELVGPGVEDLADRLSPCDDPAEAIALAETHAARWILRVDEPAEPGLTESPRVDAVTVLTGADEAAVVSSYRLLKSLTGAWEKLGNDREPDLRVAIMGAMGPRAAEARQKLDRAVAAFLQRPLEIAADAARIGAVATAGLYRAASESTADELLRMIRREQADDGPAQNKQPNTRQPGMPHDAGGLRLTTHEQDWRPSDAPAEPFDLDLGDQPDRRAEPDQTAQPEPVVIVPTPPVRRAAIAARPVATPAAGAEPRRAVASLRSLAAVLGGMTTLEARCPHAPGVELAADEHGRLHLLAADVDADGERMVDRLLSAAAWARAHLALLIRAEPLLAHPSADPAADSDAVLHLLTQTPSSTRALLEANLRVHLLVRVQIGGQSGWVAHELN